MCKCCARSFAPKFARGPVGKVRIPSHFCEGCTIATCPASLHRYGKPAGACPGPQRAMCSCCGLKEVKRIEHIPLRTPRKSGYDLAEHPFHVPKRSSRCVTCQMLSCTKKYQSPQCPKRLNEKLTARRIAVA